MKATKAEGIFESLNRIEDGKFSFKFHTQCMFEKEGELIVSKQNIELEFDSDFSMDPIDDYGQKCMMLLEQFDDQTILEEENNSIREMFFIGKIIDQIAYDLFTGTSLLTFYNSSKIEAND